MQILGYKSISRPINLLNRINQRIMIEGTASLLEIKHESSRNSKRITFKWPEVISLAILNAAISISWIAYHEYQPKLLQGYGLISLANFLLYSKAIVLIVIPPIAGLVTDILLRRGSKYFLVFSVGISLTAMTFMAVASFLGAGSVAAIQTYVPYLIVIWLVAMNIFTGPANSMIERFSSARKLPIVMAVLFFTTEIVFALEPLIIQLITFFGPTITFVFGGVLITVAGYIFHKVSSNEVLERQSSLEKSNGRRSKYLPIVTVGLLLGLCHALLVEYLPNLNELDIILDPKYYSTSLLIFAAILGLPFSIIISNNKLSTYIWMALPILILGMILMLGFPDSSLIIMIGALIVAASFSILSISGLPFALQNLSVKNITLGVGIFFGATEVADAIVEIFVM